MYKVGLTGNRFSGKKKVCKLFEDWSIPIFDADLVTKFILKYNYEIITRVKSTIGDEYVNSNREVDVKKVIKDRKFKRVMLLLEDELFKSYEDFIYRSNAVVYTIFKCSFLFEMGWDKKMNTVVNVYTPYLTRLERGKRVLGKTISIVDEIMKTEMDELDKNKNSRPIHNYNEFNLKAQVADVDDMMVSKYINDSSDYL